MTIKNNSNANYHDQQNIDNVRKMREVLDTAWMIDIFKK